MNTQGKKIILLVDDEEIEAMGCRILLEECGYNVISAHDGNDAVEIVENKKDIDLILMDIDLGVGIDGAETAAIILKNNDLPVIFFSSRDEAEIIEKTETITSYGYIVKNSNITIIDASIKMAFKLFDATQHMKAAEELVKRKNEELESLNRELEASNEELKAAVEEMEAANEELITTGEELQLKEQELLKSESRYRALVELAVDGILLGSHE